MKTIFGEFHVQPATLPHEQIREHLRNIIISGQLAAGQPIPSTRQLASLCNTHVPTVHKALVALVKEGLLVRIKGKGTFVRKREERLTCVGIYYHEDVWARHSSDFQRAVHAAVKEELNRQNVRTQVWVDPRPEAKQITPWPELCKAAERREIQGLIVPDVDWPHLDWMKKLPIPAAYLTSVNLPNEVSIDLPQLAELSLRCLAEQGCRSVGFIGWVNISTREDGRDAPKISLDFFKRFTDLANDLGLKMKDEWMRIPSPKVLARAYGSLGARQDSFGYKAVLKLLNQTDRPEGLIVFPDTTARGVILGLRDRQVRVPKDLKLVAHKNESIPLLCPMPATFVVLSERAVARAMIEQVQKQFRGESCEPITVSFTLSSTEKEIKP